MSESPRKLKGYKALVQQQAERGRDPSQSDREYRRRRKKKSRKQPKQRSDGEDELEEGVKVRISGRSSGEGSGVGIVESCRRDGTYDIRFPDGYEETRVSRKKLVVVSGGSKIRRGEGELDDNKRRTRGTDDEDESGSDRGSGGEQTFVVGQKIDVETTGQNGMVVKAGEVTRVRRGGKYFDVVLDAGGELEKVPAKRIRMPGEPPSVPSRRRASFQVGNRVEALIQQPHGSSFYVESSLCWFHRDGVTFAVHAGYGRTYAHLPRSRLRVIGATLGSGGAATPSQMTTFLLNFCLEGLVFFLFMYGGAVLLADGFRVHEDTGTEFMSSPSFMAEEYSRGSGGASAVWQGCLADAATRGLFDVVYETQGNSTVPAYALIPSDDLDSARQWLMALLVLSGATCFVLVASICYYTYCKIEMYKAGVTHPQWHHDPLSFIRCRRLLVSSELLLLLLAIAVTATYSSLLNSFRFYCLWDRDDFTLDAFAHNPWASRTDQAATANYVDEVVGKTALHMYTSMFFLIVMATATSLYHRMYLVVPSVAATAASMAKLHGAVGVMHHVQRHYAVSGHFGMNYEMDLAACTLILSFYCVAIILGHFWSVIKFRRIHPRGGRRSSALNEEDNIVAAERGDFGLGIQREARAEKDDTVWKEKGLCVYFIANNCSLWLAHLAACWLDLIILLSLLDFVSESDSRSGDWETWFSLSITLSVAWCVVQTVMPVLYVCGFSKSGARATWSTGMADPNAPVQAW